MGWTFDELGDWVMDIRGIQFLLYSRSSSIMNMCIFCALCIPFSRYTNDITDYYVLQDHASDLYRQRGRYTQ